MCKCFTGTQNPPSFGTCRFESGLGHLQARQRVREQGSRRVGRAFRRFGHTLGHIALIVALSGCQSPSEPALASIVFRADPATCRVPLVFNLLIDAKVVGTPTLAPGDSALFYVAAGQHTAGAIVGEGLTVTLFYPVLVDLEPGQRYRQTLACSG